MKCTHNIHYAHLVYNLHLVWFKSGKRTPPTRSVAVPGMSWDPLVYLPWGVSWDPMGTLVRRATGAPSRTTRDVSYGGKSLRVLLAGFPAGYRKIPWHVAGSGGDLARCRPRHRVQYLEGLLWDPMIRHRLPRGSMIRLTACHQNNANNTNTSGGNSRQLRFHVGGARNMSQELAECSGNSRYVAACRGMSRHVAAREFVDIY